MSKTEYDLMNHDKPSMNYLTSAGYFYEYFVYRQYRHIIWEHMQYYVNQTRRIQ